jgi:hypothetical protein
VPEPDHALARRVLLLGRRLEVDVLGILIVVGAAASLSWGLFVAAGEAARDPGRAQPRLGPQRCPYCHSGVRTRVRRCTSCTTIHHVDCWDEHGGCSIYGCAQAGDTAVRAAAPPALQPDDPGEVSAAEVEVEDAVQAPEASDTEAKSDANPSDEAPADEPFADEPSADEPSAEQEDPRVCQGARVLKTSAG